MAFSLQDYEIIEEIDQGGFGTILKARQKSLGRLVAIKLLSAKRTQKQSEIMRFRREAESMAVLSHDNIISVFDYAYYGNNYYIVMEYIDGITFDTALTSGIPVDMSLLILEKVINGLKVAHSENIIHRDIKPSNILLGKQGQVKLADFGLATIQPDITQHSSTNAIIGTFSYMAPEAMVSPKDVDARVDIFSLGCILYQILSGSVPFPGTSIGEVSYKVINEAPDAITVNDRMVNMLNITTLSLKKDREERPDLDSIHQAIREVITDNYHATSEALKDFIGKGKNRADPTKLSTMEFRKSSPKNIGTPILATAGVVFTSIIIILLIRQFLPIDTAREVPLPKIAALNDSSALSTLSNSKKKQVNRISDDSPKPITSTSLDLAQGTLVLAGISPADSVTINGKNIKGRVKKGKLEIPLEQGYYRVVVYRKGIKYIGRKIRVMPYQVLTLDVAKERKGHGGETR